MSLRIPLWRPIGVRRASTMTASFMILPMRLLQKDASFDFAQDERVTSGIANCFTAVHGELVEPSITSLRPGRAWSTEGMEQSSDVFKNPILQYSHTPTLHF